METGTVFEGRNGALVGVLHWPENIEGDKAVVLIVGGPQYRVGSHRQFVLLARELASAGIPVLRFDYEGMGDSDGKQKAFDEVESDIGAAVDLVLREFPEVCKLVLWGLCDGASAALMYSEADPRVSGLALVNPWVHTAAGEAKAYLRHYYLKRFGSREFWMKVGSGGWNWRVTLREAMEFLSRTRPCPRVRDNVSTQTPETFTDKMARSLEAFQGSILVILSGNDLTADEFRDWIAASKKRRKSLSRANSCVETVHEANHTFARRDWRTKVNRLTLRWLNSW